MIFFGIASTTSAMVTLDVGVIEFFVAGKVI
jgi:hypothetical protein